MSNILVTYFSAIGLILLCSLGYKRLQLDSFRADLFQLRHELFILTKEEKDLDFDTNFYRCFENLINSTIRYAHRISYLEIVFFKVWFKRKYPNIVIESSFEKVYNKKISNIKDSELKNKVISIHYRMNLLLFKYLFKISPIFMLVVICTFIKIFLEKIIQDLKMNYNIIRIFKEIRGLTLNVYSSEFKASLRLAEDNPLAC